jgi:hypothetical protein
MSTIVLIHPPALILETGVASADGLVCCGGGEDEESEAEREEHDPGRAHENISNNVEEHDRNFKECVGAARGHVNGQTEHFVVYLGATGHDRGVQKGADDESRMRVRPRWVLG